MPYVGDDTSKPYYPNQGAPYSLTGEFLPGYLHNAQLTQSVINWDNLNISVNYVSDTDVAIATKFSSTEDMVVRFRSIPNNEILGIGAVVLVPNTNPLPLSDPKNYDENTDGVTELAKAISEYVGPVNTNVGGWTGGSHLKDGYKTADTISVNLIADNLPLQIGDEGYYSDIKLGVTNKLYKPDVLPTQTELIREYQEYTVKNNSIDVYVNHGYRDSFTIWAYYGLQTDNSAYFDDLYFSNSSNLSTRVYASGESSGDRATYQNVDMCGTLASDKSLCQLMWLDRSLGLGSSPLTYTTSDWFFTSGSKAYARLIQDQPVQVASSTEWHGCYAWGRDVQGGGNGIFAIPFTTTSKDLVGCAVDANQVVYAQLKEEYFGSRLIELGSSNQHGLIAWSTIASPSELNKFSWANASSCVYEIVSNK